MKKVFLLAVLLMSIGCSDADVASRNLSKAAEQFEIVRRIVFFNGITDKYLLIIEGRCSVQISSSVLAVTCKTGDGQYKKHYLGLSDNVSYLSEQVDGKGVSVDHYRIIFKPSAIVPNIDLK